MKQPKWGRYFYLFHSPTFQCHIFCNTNKTLAFISICITSPMHTQCYSNWGRIYWKRFIKKRTRRLFQKYSDIMKLLIIPVFMCLTTKVSGKISLTCSSHYLNPLNCLLVTLFSVKQNNWSWTVSETEAI